MRAVLLILFALLYSCGDGGGGSTTRGLTIKADSGVTVLPAHRAAMERGLNEAFARARCSGHTDGLNVGEFTVVIKQGLKDSAGNPALKIPCGSYCGTEWDKGGYILIAGQVVSDEIVIPEHGEEFDHLATIVGYEAEHLILKRNDMAEYNRTKIHKAGAGHPIIPECR